MFRVSPMQYLLTQEVKMQKLRKERTFSAKNQPFEIKFLLLALHHKTIARWSQIVTVLLHICAFAYTEQGKLSIYYQYKELHNNVVAFIDFLSDLLLVAVNILQVINLTRSTFFIEVYRFASKKKFIFMKHQDKILRRYILILRLLPIVPICLCTYFFGTIFGWYLEQYFIAKDIWYISIHMIICSAICITYEIRKTFSHMNDNLERICNIHPISVISTDDPQKIHLKPHGSLNSDNKIENLMILTNDYTDLCNLLDKLNHYSKANMLMLVMCTVVNILYNITVIIEYAIKPKNINGTDVKIIVFVHQLMLAVASMGQTAGAAFVGESLEEEGQRTTRICYTVLNKLNRSTKNDIDNLVIKELNFLLDQSKSRMIYLCAGGFFKLNWGLLGSITSTIATYSIVIIQFLLK